MSGDINTRALAEARRWLGTPYRHQGAVQGAGCDCLGLIRGIWQALYAEEPERVPPYSRDWAERDSDERLWRAALRHLCEVEAGQERAGQVLLFRMRSGAVAKHLGLASGRDRFIHAYSGHGVVESALTPAWSRRIVARFEFPDTTTP
ncbi:NlpC/P60 family protein [Phaeobacter sp. B1627]|uniref:NlpC/P60 family protein n=1 Tax=Phaeobacter sp. B1627 TaxID=2583809 RepID=UPI0011180812|nr:NlpC/P60 family protein [Phaeobacter sp. B1627]TNJ46731.1 peptidase [Phaeobacter sp. B1627]